MSLPASASKTPAFPRSRSKEGLLSAVQAHRWAYPRTSWCPPASRSFPCERSHGAPPSCCSGASPGASKKTSSLKGTGWYKSTAGTSPSAATLNSVGMVQDVVGLAPLNQPVANFGTGGRSLSLPLVRATVHPRHYRVDLLLRQAAVVAERAIPRVCAPGGHLSRDDLLLDGPCSTAGLRCRRAATSARSRRDDDRSRNLRTGSAPRRRCRSAPRLRRPPAAQLGWTLREETSAPTPASQSRRREPYASYPLLPARSNCPRLPPCRWECGV